VTVPLLDRDGVRVYYECHGGGAGTPLLLTHGYSLSSRTWEHNLPAIGAGRTVITWDIRGHGRSDAAEDPAYYSAELSVGDMAAVLDAAGVGRAAVGGLSLGGFLSLEFYLRHPERVAALLLFDTGPGYRRDEPRDEWNGRVERIAAAQPTRGLALAARGIMAQRDARVIESLPTIGVPTLVVVGAEDRPYLAAADYMATRIPNAVKVVIDGAGHESNVDRPDAFDRAVVEFLEAV
jgi:pimeloyl-ACP methyl ester carboxylesterase